MQFVHTDPRARDIDAALIVIDMQRAALDGCTDASEVIELINGLSRRAVEAEVPVIFIQHEGGDEPERGAPGWEFAEGLERPDGSLVVPKIYRDGFADTDLEALLTRLGVRRLVITGAHSDYCVQTTALSALIHGFDVVLVSDAHLASPDDPTLSADALRQFVNARFTSLRHPRRTIEVLPAAEVRLDSGHSRAAAL